VAHRVNLRARGAYHFTYSGRCVLITDLAGRVGEQDPLGLYVDNVRLLSRLEVSVNGKSPRPMSASPVGGDAFLAYEELPQADGLPRESVYLETARFVGEGMRTVLRLLNYGPEEARCELAIHLAADFADSQEAEQQQRQQNAEVETTWDHAAAELTFPTAIRSWIAASPSAWSARPNRRTGEREPCGFS